MIIEAFTPSCAYCGEPFDPAERGATDDSCAGCWPKARAEMRDERPEHQPVRVAFSRRPRVATLEDVG